MYISVLIWSRMFVLTGICMLALGTWAKAVTSYVETSLLRTTVVLSEVEGCIGVWV